MKFELETLESVQIEPEQEVSSTMAPKVKISELSEVAQYRPIQLEPLASQNSDQNPNKFTILKRDSQNQEQEVQQMPEESVEPEQSD